MLAGSHHGREERLIGKSRRMSRARNGKDSHVALEFVHTCFENASPLDWEVDGGGVVHVRLLYDHERGSVNRAAGHWHFQIHARAGDAGRSPAALPGECLANVTHLAGRAATSAIAARSPVPTEPQESRPGVKNSEASRR